MEGSATKDHYASNSNMYMNSFTENTVLYPAVSTGNIATGGGQTGEATGPSGNTLEVPKLQEGKKKEDHLKVDDDDADKKKSTSPRALPHMYEKRKDHTSDSLTVIKATEISLNVQPPGGVGEHAYNVLEEPVHTMEPESPYDVPSPTESTAGQSEFIAGSSTKSRSSYQVPSLNKNPTASSAEPTPHYDVLDDATTSSATSSPTYQVPSGNQNAAYISDDAVAPSPPSSMRPSQRNRNKNSFVEAYAYTSVTGDDRDLSPPPTEKGPARILHYADSFIGRNRENYESLDTSRTCEPNYETLNKEGIVDDDDCTDKPRKPVRRDSGLTLVDNEGNEDTFL